ncbi:hypothetical protein EBAPG3_011260 [Nitrosospira lacus]|uniref:Uncharacterized protein n=2 Tax=Nitrosospira lacus TaxID=1288494 RepID=A0A1W6SR90_9PROT|nr:hypothetical protein EBAPG3_011260 [Nitrosospira lacus]
MEPEPRRVYAKAVKSISQKAPLLMPINRWKSDAIGITAYVFEESETTLRQSGLVPEWVGYPPECPGAGIAVPAHHSFPNYLKLLRLQSGRLRLVIDARAVLRGDTSYQRLLCNLLADTQLSLVKGEAV